MGDIKIKRPATKGTVKVPVIMQMEALECGAASLCMIMAYYDKWVPLEQVRKACGVSRDGSKAGNILRAARNYGFSARGFRCDPEALQQNGTFPCIIHWGFNHFVVLDGFKKNKVYLNDPARGNYVVSMEVFDENFTGICLLFEPGEGFAPEGKPKSMLSFARKRMEGAHTALLFVALTTIITSLAGIISSGLSRVFMDRMLTGLEPAWYHPFLLGFAGISLVTLIAAWIQAIYSLVLNGKMAVSGNAGYLWKVLRLPQEFFSQRYAGDIQMRMQSNASIAKNIVYTVAPLGLNTVTMVFYLVVMIRYSWFLTLIGLFSVLVQVLMAIYISRKRVNVTRVMMRDSGKLAAATTSAIEMIETIKASGAENGYFERWAGYQASVNTQNNRYQEMNQYLGLVPQLVNGLTNSAILVIGIWLAMQGRFTAGMILAFQGFLSSFMGPAFSLIGAGQTIQEMRTEMERIDDVMDYPDDIMVKSLTQESENEDKSCSKLKGNVTMRNVTFGYSILEEPLIKDFNLEIRPGQRVAFVGTSGCGKSTIAKLVSGLYQPWSGEILFDGVNATQIVRDAFTSSIAVVDQDIILFEGTVGDNIRMWDKSIEDFEVILAARDAQIHDLILKREGGYNYQIAEGGRDFSGGERQRLEIARVLAQDPTIIIMDEATSALDARTEYDVVSAIKDRGISCIVIAHRLSTIRDSDEIIVMDQGKVVERGTHEQLMELDGYYKKLVSSE